MKFSRPVLATLALSAFFAHGQHAVAAAEVQASADAIMARVAENQDRTEAARSHYVYVQHARVISRKGKTVMCEEVTDFRITPTDKGFREELLKLNGRLLAKHKYVSYTTLAPDKKDEDKKKEDQKRENQDHHDSISMQLGDDMDRDLVENMRHNFTHDDDSKDGINSRLFPLTSKQQKDYAFHLVGRERMNGRDVFHITFSPKDKDEFAWKGDAYIDTAAYEPVVVSTDMSRKVPLAVRTLLGTNVPGLGFTVVYAPQPDGVWFPVTFGTEFRMHVLFLLRREIVIDAANREFEKTHVDSQVVIPEASLAP